MLFSCKIFIQKHLSLSMMNIYIYIFITKNAKWQATKARSLIGIASYYDSSYKYRQINRYPFNPDQMQGREIPDHEQLGTSTAVLCSCTGLSLFLLCNNQGTFPPLSLLVYTLHLLFPFFLVPPSYLKPTTSKSNIHINSLPKLFSYSGGLLSYLPFQSAFQISNSNAQELWVKILACGGLDLQSLH